MSVLVYPDVSSSMNQKYDFEWGVGPGRTENGTKFSICPKVYST